MAPARGRTSVFLIAFIAGCSLDFTVRPQPGDGGAPLDAGADSGEDADSASPMPDASIPDADAGAPIDCEALKQEVADALEDAKTCVLASGHCTETVKNQCNCDVVIATAGSAAAATYETAVTKYKASGCALGCGAACPSTANRNCLQSSGATTCFP